MPDLTPFNGLSIRKPAGSKPLPDNDQWTNRFEIRSESSNRVYIVSQNKASGLWACSCPGWISNRTCKHLKDGCGLVDKQIHGRAEKLLKKQEQMG